MWARPRLAPRRDRALCSRIEPAPAPSKNGAHQALRAPGVPARRIRAALWLQLAMGALLWTYALVRAGRLSFSHDEALTFLYSVLAPLSDTLSFSGYLPSNNHLLNSLLTKLAVRFGEDPLTLRLPNLLAFALYLATAFALTRSLRRPLARVLAYAVLTLHPFLLDFFSMCRGYGLACAFTLLALLLFQRCVSDPRSRAGLACGASLAAALAVLANLSFLVFFLALVGVLCAAELFKRARAGTAARSARSGGSLRATLALQAAVGAALCAYVVPIGLKLRAMGELYYGGERGFLEDTLGTLLDASLYDLPYPLWVRGALQLLGAALFAASLLSAIRVARAGQLTPLWLCALPLVTATICVVQHHLLGTRYPVDRTALFFLPMFGVALISALDAWPGRRLGVAALALPALLLSLNAARSFNVEYLAAWRYDAATRRMLEDLSRAREGRTVRLGRHWLFGPALLYYRRVLGLPWLQEAELQEACDFYYFPDDDTNALGRRPLQPVRRYDTALTTLASPAR